MSYAWRLLLLFGAAKAYVILVGAIVAALFTPYVNNTDLLFAATPSSGAADDWARRLLAPFARWDAVYFVKIALDGYRFEQQHAFSPLFPAVLRAGACLLWPVLPWLSLLSRVLLAGVLCANLSHLATVLNIFQYPPTEHPPPSAA